MIRADKYVTGTLDLSNRVDTLAVEFELQLRRSCASGDLPCAPYVGVLVGITKTALVVALSPRV
jgi:hypothetical protein